MKCRSRWADWWEPRLTASSHRAVPHGGVAMGTAAPRRRRWLRSLKALWGIRSTPEERSDSPRTRRTTVVQPSRCTSTAIPAAHLPKVASAADISSTFRLVRIAEAPAGDACQGGAVRSQGDSASVPVGTAVSPWRPRRRCGEVLTTKGEKPARSLPRGCEWPMRGPAVTIREHPSTPWPTNWMPSAICLSAAVTIGV